MNICDSQLCTGCFCCAEICPKGCITEKTDYLGKTIPFVDEEKCSGCGLCVKHCPVNSPPEFKEPLRCLAAVSGNEGDRKSCASGGLATVFGRNVLQGGGVVFGSAFDKGLLLRVTRCGSLEELEAVKGSKYVFSNPFGSFVKVKNDLESGREVLFAGTPCQVAGLLSFVGKQRENLFMVDLICHGTPPMSYLSEYITSLEKEKADGLTFRGENNYFFTLYSGEKIIHKESSSENLYFRAFLKSLIHRENCYNCPYATEKRVSDITIGDFWGLDKASLKRELPGRISVALINTEKGERLWNRCADSLLWEERFVAEAVAENEQLKHPSKKHLDRELFEKNYQTEGFTQAVKKTSLGKAPVKTKKPGLLMRIRGKLGRMLKRI